VGQLRFGTDGVRGQALTELTPEYVAALGRAAAQVLGGDVWLVGRDTRQSGPQLSQALIDGLCAGGARPSVTGIMPTPALAFLSARLGVPAAMVTASHNPWQDNGIKIFGAGGVKLSDDVERAIEAAIGAPPPLSMPAPPVVSAAVAEYCEHMVGMLGAGSLAGMRIVLDCANGAMHHAAPSVALRLGATVVPINTSPNGRNINEQCGATHPAALSAAVISHRADLGLAFDGDGDRVIAVDHRGKVVDGDRLIALAALQLRDEGNLTNDSVVVTVMSNLGFHKAMAAAGVNVITTAVGDRYVLEALDAGNYAIGGEQSGHIIYRHQATTGDGLLAGLRVAQHVRRQSRSLAELADAVMTSYPQVLVNVKVANRHPQVAEEMAAEIAAAESSLKGDGRILVRPSGTEPLIRVMVEAATQPLAQIVAHNLAGVVLSRFG
jgi:phosphoglucosamine mutase